MKPDFYIDQLSRLPPDRALDFKSTGAWIRCINPLHAGGNERTPSACITVEEGSPFLGRYNCFGCGLNTSWNEFATKVGLAIEDKNYKSYRTRRLGFRQKAKKEPTQHAVQSFQWPVSKEWRGISGHTVSLLKGFVYETRDSLEEPTLIFPIEMYGEKVGAVKALIRDAKKNVYGKKIEQSYINSSGKWIRSAFMGFDIASRSQFKNRPLWIVEGPRDVGHSIEAGNRVVGLLGSYFGEERAELVKLLNPCAVIIATDSDMAGDKVAQRILDECASFVPVVRAEWKTGQDTFDQPIEKLQRIDQRVYSKYGERRANNLQRKHKHNELR